jgi:hypothetical protein
MLCFSKYMYDVYISLNIFISSSMSHLYMWIISTSFLLGFEIHSILLFSVVTYCAAAQPNSFVCQSRNITNSILIGHYFSFLAHHIFSLASESLHSTFNFYNINF